MVCQIKFRLWLQCISWGSNSHPGPIFHKILWLYTISDLHGQWPVGIKTSRGSFLPSSQCFPVSLLPSSRWITSWLDVWLCFGHKHPFIHLFDGKNRCTSLVTGPLIQSWSRDFCRNLEKPGNGLVIAGASGSPFAMSPTPTTLCFRRADPAAGAGRKLMPADRA